MHVLANVLLVASGALLLLLALSPPRSSPEGPVGAHLVTLPLALGQAGALGLAAAGGALERLGVSLAWVYAALPGQVVALTFLPVLALERSGRPARVAVVLAVAGAALCVDGATFAPGTAVPLRAGALLVAATAAFGYGLVLTFVVQQQRRATARAREEVVQRSEFEERQAEWQLGEWRKVPANAPLWRLVQFSHAFHPDVKRECLARLAALPDLDRSMSEALGTGWADQALGYLRDHYPHSRAAVAPALAAYLDAQCEEWRKTLDGAPQPGSYFGNVAAYVEAAASVHGDGGDLGASLQRWGDMLRGRRGLEPLADRARALACAR